MKELRKLRADEIEIRKAQTKDDKTRYLLYMNSRCATDLLDEWVGKENWTMSFYEAAGLLFCKIQVWDAENQRWIERSDTGSESNIEKDKGKVSDCIKRTVSRFGWTELYTAPTIWLPDRGDYYVSDIAISNDRKITHLVISSNQGVALDWTLGQKMTAPATKDNATILKEWCSAHKHKEGYSNDDLKDFYGYWMGRIEGGKFNGVFQPDQMWAKQQNRRANC